MRRTLAVRSSVLLAAGGVRLPSEDIMLAGRRNLQAQASAGQAGQQAGDLLQQLAPMLKGAGGAAGAAGGAASALGPIGLALGAGSAANGLIKQATTDENGFAKTGTGATIARSLGSVVDPLGTIMSGVSNLQRDDLSTVQKIGSFVPGVSALVTRGADERARKKFERAKMQENISAGVMANQEQNYQGVQYAQEGTKLARTSVRRLADGGKPKATAKPSLRTPTPEAQNYYNNFLPVQRQMIREGYDEVITDPTTGAQTKKNSCLGFACSVAEKAGATGQQRQLLNSDFTATSGEQGWQRIPIKQVQPGDRVQRWVGEEHDPANYADKVARLGGNQFIKGKYPAHMTMYSGMSTVAGRGDTPVLFQDGDESKPARLAALDINIPFDDQNWVVYRYIGVNGQPTNNPKEAVAANPAAAAPVRQPSTAMRRKGGRVPGGCGAEKKSCDCGCSKHAEGVAHHEDGGSLDVAVIASGALHSEKHRLGEGDVGTHGIPILDVTGKRKAELERDELTLPLSTTQQLEKLRADKDYLGMGRLMQRQITSSTIPSRRFAKRLASGGTLTPEPVTADHTMLMLDEAGKVQMPLRGEERIISREHTRELVHGSLKSTSPVQLRKLGRRVATIFNGHDRRADKTS